MSDCVARCVGQRFPQFNYFLARFGSFLLSISVYFALFTALYCHKQHKREMPRYADLQPFYDVNVTDDGLKAKFVQLNRDEDTEDFIQWSIERSNSFLLQIFYGVTAPLLKLFTTKTATNGILFRGEMFVFSPSQFKKLLPELFDSPDALEFKFPSWLDLGAGDGGALVRGVRPLARDIFATEICPVMRKRLEWRGFTVEDVVHWKSKKWKVISMLNLLDRAGNPDSFLENASHAIEDDGFLFIAIVLPFNPYVERGGTGESKPITDVSHYQCKSRKYPEQLKCFVSAVEKWNFELKRWSSVPYLCEGDRTTPFYMLRDTLLLFQKKKN